MPAGHTGRERSWLLVYWTLRHSDWSRGSLARAFFISDVRDDRDLWRLHNLFDFRPGNTQPRPRRPMVQSGSERNRLHAVLSGRRVAGPPAGDHFEREIAKCRFHTTRFYCESSWAKTIASTTRLFTRRSS